MVMLSRSFLAILLTERILRSFLAILYVWMIFRNFLAIIQGIHGKFLDIAPLGCLDRRFLSNYCYAGPLPFS